MSICYAMDLTTTRVRQSARAFGVAHECPEVSINVQIMNKASIDKLASVEEKIKKLRAKAEVMRAQKAEDMKNEVHESHLRWFL